MSGLNSALPFSLLQVFRLFRTVFHKTNLSKEIGSVF